MTYVLILYAWTISVHAGSGITTAEFTTQEKCNTAAAKAKAEFDGIYSKLYWVCVEK
jgi:hypothetical protein